jgi:hypothetical protein
MGYRLETRHTLKSVVGSGAEQFIGSVIVHVELDDQVQIWHRLQDVVMHGRGSRQLVDANPVLPRATCCVLSIQLLSKQSSYRMSSVSV